MAVHYQVRDGNGNVQYGADSLVDADKYAERLAQRGHSARVVEVRTFESVMSDHPAVKVKRGIRVRGMVPITFTVDALNGALFPDDPIDTRWDQVTDTVVDLEGCDHYLVDQLDFIDGTEGLTDEVMDRIQRIVLESHWKPRIAYD